MTLLIIMLLIGVNALFVAAEFAIVGVSRLEVERAVRAGNSAGRLVQFVISDPRRMDRFSRGA